MSLMLYDKKRIRLIIAIIIMLFVLLSVYAIFIVHTRSLTKEPQKTSDVQKSCMNMANPLLETLKRNSGVSSYYLKDDEKKDKDALESFEQKLLGSDLFLQNSSLSADPNETLESHKLQSNVLLDELDTNYKENLSQLNDSLSQNKIDTDINTYVYDSGVEDQSLHRSMSQDTQSLYDKRISAFNDAVKSSSRLNIGQSGGLAAVNDRAYAVYPVNAANTAVSAGSLSGGAVHQSTYPSSGPILSEDKNKAISTLDGYKVLEHNNYTLKHKVQTVSTPYLLRQGAVLPAILLTGINSSLPGQVSAQITRNVYDTPTGRYLLIPRGSKLIGQYNASPAMGAERVMLGFNRLVFPDGRALDLGAMPVSGNDGMAGLEADVNTHLMRLLTYSALLGTISASVSIAGGREYDDNGRVTGSSALSEALTQSLGAALSESIRQNMAIAPTLEVGSGYPFNLTLTSDIYFDNSYKDYNY